MLHRRVVARCRTDNGNKRREMFRERSRSCRPGLFLGVQKSSRLFGRVRDSLKKKSIVPTVGQPFGRPVARAEADIYASFRSGPLTDSSIRRLLHRCTGTARRGAHAGSSLFLALDVVGGRCGCLVGVLFSILCCSLSCSLSLFDRKNR